MAVYSLAVFLMKRGTKFPLYYSIWCILLIFTLDTLDKLLLVKVLPGISLSAVIFIWYTASNWMIFFLLLMTHEFLPSGFSRWAVRVDLVIYSLLQLMMLITKPVIYSELSVLSKCVGIAGIFCTIGIVIIGIRNKQKEGWLFLCCITIIAITYIHDSFYLTNKINDGSLLYYGIFICSFIQVIIQINRVRNIINRMVSAELNFLQAQIKPHFLFNAINTFIALTYYNIDQARDLLKDFADYLKRSFDLKSKDRYVPLKNELELVRAYVNIEKVRFGRRLEVVFDVDQEYEGMVPILILQPVIENAILHGVIPKQDGGCVLVIIRKKNRELEFTVKDDGVGMPPEILEHLPENKDGVGLKNIMQRLEKLYRKGLSIHSIPGKGTEVSWSIPLDKRRRL